MARKGTVEDIAECWSLHGSLGLPYTKRSWRILPEMWRTLLSRGAMQLCLVASQEYCVAYSRERLVRGLGGIYGRSSSKCCRR